MINHKKVAVVILNWNGTKLLQQFLPSVLEHSKDEDVRVIVADNGSTDHSVEFLKNNFPSVEVIKLKTNYGFAKGYNKALKDIEADYFILLNSDVEVSKNWITPCISRMENDPGIAAIQPKILNFNNKETFEYAGATGGFIDKFGYPFCRGRILNIFEKDEKQYNKATSIFWASGSCLFINAELFIKYGGFDDDFWAHMEEIDLCWRLKNSGYSIWYEPKSVIYHLGGGTLSYQNPKKIYLNFRNNLQMIYKNLPEKKVYFILFARMILDGIAAIRFLTELNLKAFSAVFNAHIYFYKNLRTIRKKRKQAQTTSKNSNHQEIYPKSIIWKFYVQKKQRFQDLGFNS